MRVEVALPQVLRACAGGVARIDVDVADHAALGGLLDELATRHPALERRLRDERGVLRRHVNFYLDGEECRGLDGADTALSEGAEVRVVPSVAGG